MTVKGVHFNREISLGHVIQAIAVVLPLLAYGINMDKRLSIAEVRIEQMSREYKQDIADIKATLSRIETRLDNKQDKN